MSRAKLLFLQIMVAVTVLVFWHIFSTVPLGTGSDGKPFYLLPQFFFSTPLDVANAALYLASDEASMISGVCLEVDGARCV